MLVTTPAEALTSEARKWVGTKELTQNWSDAIKEFLAAVGINTPAPWCAAFAFYCISQVEKTLGIHSPLYKCGHVLTVWNHSPQSQRLTTPEVGSLAVWQHYSSGAPTSEGHIGIVTGVPKPNIIQTIEGNTSGSSFVDRSGDGVFQKIRPFPSLSRLMVIKGFLRPF